MARSNMTAYRNELKLGETLTQEFKSDIARLNDRELVAAVVALANTDTFDLGRVGSLLSHEYNPDAVAPNPKEVAAE